MHDYLKTGKLPKKSVAAFLSNAAEEGKLTDVLSDSTIYNEEYFPINETEMNTLGYYLLGKSKEKDALEIFKLNASAFANSWNTHDSLGECLLNMGDEE